MPKLAPLSKSEFNATRVLIGAVRNTERRACTVRLTSRYDQIETAQEDIRRSNVMERRANKNLFVTIG